MSDEPEQPEEGQEPVDEDAAEAAAALPEAGGVPGESAPAESTPDEPAAEPAPDEPAAESTPDEPAPEPAPDEPAAESTPDEPAPDEAPDEPAAEEPPAESGEPEVADAAAAQAEAAEPEPDPNPAEPAPEAPSAKPEIPGADLEVDIVPEGSDPLARAEAEAAEAEAARAQGADPGPEVDAEPAPVAEEAPQPRAVIDLGADARYRATGKRKTAIARVILRPGKGEYTINGRGLDEHFPRPTLQRNIRQPLETVGYESRMDVVAKLHGGGISAQAGALRHGISRALIEADPNLRGELKRRGFLTRDPRVKERKKAGLKKARKRPQFSKR